MKIIKYFGDLIILSFLWLIGSLPIVTVGAATSALMVVCEKKVKGEETNNITDFIQSYKEKFIASFGITLIIFIIWFATLGYSFSVLLKMNEGFNLNVILMLIFLFESMMVSFYLCGLFKKYDLGTLSILKNAIIFIHAYFKESAQAFILIVATLFLSVNLPIFLIILPATLAIIASSFLNVSIGKYKNRLKILEEINSEENS